MGRLLLVTLSLARLMNQQWILSHFGCIVHLCGWTARDISVLSEHTQHRQSAGSDLVSEGEGVVFTLTSSSLHPISRSQSTQWQWVSMKSGSSFSSPISRGTEVVAPVSIWTKENDVLAKTR